MQEDTTITASLKRSQLLLLLVLLRRRRSIFEAACFGRGLGGAADSALKFEKGATWGLLVTDRRVPEINLGFEFCMCLEEMGFKAS